jgi:hypothetical protein
LVKGDVGPNGRDMPISPAMVARKPGHQGEREISRKTVAQETPGCPVNLW